MSSTVVKYGLDDAEVFFEIEPTSGFIAAGVGPDEVIAQVKKAVEPAVAGAKAVLDAVRSVGPDELEVKFGIKVSGTMNWWVAKAATEGNFEITLTWKSDAPTAEA